MSNFDRIMEQVEDEHNLPNYVYANLMDDSLGVVATMASDRQWAGAELKEIAGKHYFYAFNTYYNIDQLTNRAERYFLEQKWNLRMYNEFTMYMDMLICGYKFNPHYTVPLLWSPSHQRCIQAPIIDVWYQFIYPDEVHYVIDLTSDDGADVPFDTDSIATFDVVGPIDDDILDVWSAPIVPAIIDVPNLRIDLRDGHEIIDLTNDIIHTV